MKKLLFVTINKMHEHDGVSKKIISQVNALSKLGFIVDFASAVDGGASFECDVSNPHREKIYILRVLKYSFYLALAIFLRRTSKQYDCAYIRNPHGGFFAFFLPLLMKHLKVNGCKEIYLEIPTYPYENEISGWKGKLSHWSHKISRPFFLKYVDQIVYMGDPVDGIWGKPVIRIANGIDAKTLPLQSNPVRQNPLTELSFIAVARMETWHGYDRFIAGMAAFYSQNKSVPVDVRLHIVGDNEPCLGQLKSQVYTTGLSEKVIFHGALSGAALDTVFSRCQIAIDALGRHRTGNNFNSSLKSKEYTARGIPFIKSHIDDSFLGCQFVLDCPADESSIDIGAVIDWHIKNKACPLIMRQFAEDSLSWSKQFQFMVH